MAEIAPKKRTTKKATKRTTTKKVVTKKVARRVTRKAAPRRLKMKESKGMSFVTLAVVWIVFLGVGTAALYYGYSDEGQIDVSERISAGGGETITGDPPPDPGRGIPVTNSMPNGGLVPADVSQYDAPPPPEPEDTASSTDDTASSTEEVEVDEEEGVDGSTAESTDDGEQREDEEVAEDVGADTVADTIAEEGDGAVVPETTTEEIQEALVEEVLDGTE